MKAGKLHAVPLSPQALAIIKELPRWSGELVFPSRRGIGPVRSFTHVKRRLDELSGVGNWKLHDIRRTTATGIAELGFEPHIVGACLGHSRAVTLGPVTAIYNQHQYLTEKRAALSAWGAEVERLVGGE